MASSRFMNEETYTPRDFAEEAHVALTDVGAYAKANRGRGESWHSHDDC